MFILVYFFEGIRSDTRVSAFPDFHLQPSVEALIGISYRVPLPRVM
ncbi:glucose-methanol-choline oxidoreductase [Paenibacillus lactis 154]|uniref:Glucose-methanol-choline oxidoreductase n=1 Tax=Paenibacillus lactis 154 TaxID=743719 RepID=G4HPC2_9BACL|nr:glucose-methanol-choline oxidoreductase [Paenibacillus lactis 154]